MRWRAPNASSANSSALAQAGAAELGAAGRPVRDRRRIVDRGGAARRRRGRGRDQRRRRRPGHRRRAPPAAPAARGGDPPARNPARAVSAAHRVARRPRTSSPIANRATAASRSCCKSTGKSNGEHRTKPARASDRPAAPTRWSIVPVRGTVLFPGLVLPMAVTRPKSVAAAQEAVRRGAPVGFLLQRDADAEDPGPADLYQSARSPACCAI